MLTDDPGTTFLEWANLSAKRQPRPRHFWLGLDHHLPDDLVHDLNRLFKVPLANKAQMVKEDTVKPDVTFSDSEPCSDSEPASKTQKTMEEKVERKPSKKQVEKEEREAKKKASDLALVRYEQELSSGPGIKRSYDDLKGKEDRQKEALKILRRLSIKKEPK